MSTRPTPEETALHIFKEKFSDCKVMFLAGSVMRGEGTIHSDLDIVVVYEKLEAAWRDSFHYDNWPIEVFVHDPTTLNYFYEKFDKATGIPSLANMVIEGKEIPCKDEFSGSLKSTARTVIENGPEKWTIKEIDRGRYLVTDICDDLRKPRSHEEMVASTVQLYEALTSFYFRSRNEWSAKGKTIPTRWKQYDFELAKEFISVFELAFSKKDSSEIIKFSEKILLPYGGWLFQNSKTIAPKEWRIVEN
jgi:predicted nucleotidyltransferase